MYIIYNIYIIYSIYRVVTDRESRVTNGAREPLGHWRFCSQVKSDNFENIEGKSI